MNRPVPVPRSSPPDEPAPCARAEDLPELAVEDAIKAHQRPKFERYGDTLFVVLKAARYRYEAGEVEFGELHLKRRNWI